MKQFFSDHSYDMVKMFLNQFATSLFGLTLTLVAGRNGNAVFRNIVSVCAILFYLFLLYTMTWSIGFKDRSAVENGNKPNRPWKGVLISLCANILNILIALFITLAMWFDVPVLSAIGGVMVPASSVLEGMYSGILVNTVGGAPLNSYWFMYFIIILPSLIVCGISYFLGLKDKKFTGLFDHVYPASDREPKQKRFSKKNDENSDHSEE